MRWTSPVLLLAIAACKSPDNSFNTFDNPPSVTITDPAEGTTYDEGTLIDFAALSADDGSTLQVTWASDLDGNLFEEASTDEELLFSTANLSVGSHAISLLVVDEAAQSATANTVVTIEAVAEEPLIAVVHPITGETGIEGTPYTMQAQVQDQQDEPLEMRVSFSSDVDGVLCDEVVPDLASIASCSATPSAGLHSLTFEVVDSDGLSASAVALFEVESSADIDNDGDGFSENQGDCNDANPQVSPVAVELFNGVDDDCDGLIDNNTTGYDDDGDGFTELEGDCDDADELINPDATEFADGIDNDCDGLIDNGTDTFDDDGDGFSEATGDCDDTNININPNAADVPYNGVDEDCDGSDNADVDGDGYDSDIAGGADCDDNDSAVNPGATEDPYNGEDEDCDGADLDDVDGDGFPSTVVNGGTDCDDLDADINPDAIEVPYNGVDEDCIGGDLLDADGDGQNASTQGGQDCDDTNPAVFTGAVEVPYDGMDQDCDGLDLVDVDGDGFEGGPNGDDCNDMNLAVNPGATEIRYNGIDEDCDGVDVTDFDGDGYEGGPNGTGEDCDDDNEDINPGSTEVPYNLVDENCDGVAVDDVDQDGSPGGQNGPDCDDNDPLVSPAAVETCDGADNNCNGSVDEEGASGCSTHYIDGDGDGFGSNVSACTCGPDFPYEVTNANDCYDNNSQARPGQTSWFSIDRGDGSYDYDCNGASSRRWTVVGGECSIAFFDCDEQSGWEGSAAAPSCGQSRDYIDGCDGGFPICADFDFVRTQQCR